MKRNIFYTICILIGLSIGSIFTVDNSEIQDLVNEKQELQVENLKIQIKILEKRIHELERNQMEYY